MLPKIQVSSSHASFTQHGTWKTVSATAAPRLTKMNCLLPWILCSSCCLSEKTRINWTLHMQQRSFQRPSNEQQRLLRAQLQVLFTMAFFWHWCGQHQQVSWNIRTRNSRTRKPSSQVLNVKNCLCKSSAHHDWTGKNETSERRHCNKVAQLPST